MRQPLRHLNFEATCEEFCAHARDAIASVLPYRMTAVLTEVQLLPTSSVHLLGPLPSAQ